MQLCRLVTPWGAFKERKNCLFQWRTFLSVDIFLTKTKNGLWTTDCGLGIKDRLRNKTRNTDYGPGIKHGLGVMMW